MTNGEKYKTAEERKEAHDKWCNKQTSRKCVFSNCANCAFDWLNLESEDDEPMPCPFCGSDCSVIDNGGDLFVQCSNEDCLYSGKLTPTKDAAIAAHNRVCKAAAAYKENN